MKKILGLDVGERRIGVAIAEKKLVAPYGLIEYRNLQEAINEIGKICRAEQIEKIIIGLPQNEDRFQMDKIYSFAQELTKNLQIPISFIDETLTSKEAERTLAGIKDRRSKRFKSEVDKIAAQLILEQYLEKNS